MAKKKKKKFKKAQGLTTTSQTSDVDVFELQNELFTLLDDAKFAPATILTSDKHKQHYETLAMFAFRKLAAARYHAKRIDELYDSHRQRAEHALGKKRRPKGGPKVTAVSTSIQFSAGEFVYELSAFFSAVRSALDFVARLCVQHTKQMIELDSISKFLSMAEEGRSGATVDVVAKHANWLKHLRDYRDYLVHHLTITTLIGSGRVWKDGKWHEHSMPVAVPENTPKFVPDTRASRAMDSHPHGLTVTTMEMSATGGRGELIDSRHSTTYAPAAGYALIENLMKSELERFEAFYADVLKVLIEANFSPILIGPKKKESASDKKAS